jgi:hypothetical protein
MEARELKPMQSFYKKRCKNRGCKYVVLVRDMNDEEECFECKGGK